MTNNLTAPNVNLTPDSLLESYIAAAASRTAPIPIDSDEGKRLYRALAQHLWCRQQRPVVASDIRDLWERIDSIKRGSRVEYGITGVHFWASDFANALGAESVALDPESNQRLAAWIEEWPNVCILGQTGRGKSSTINRLFGVKMAEISHHTSCTKTVSDYRLVTGSFLGRPTGVVMWDVPGYGDDHIPWDRHVKLYRRMARKCDVVVFMLDNDRSFSSDLRMFKKLKKNAAFESKLVVCINKADLFHPCNWNEKSATPSDEMMETIRQRCALVGDILDLRNRQRVVPISALKNWNIFTLLTSMVEAAGESKGARLLQSVRPTLTAADLNVDGGELAKRFGIRPALRSHFRSVIAS